MAYSALRVRRKIWPAAATGELSVNSSSGRAVMHWFDASERGLALGVRQTAIPIGGFVGALALPPIAEAGGSEAAFLFLAALCVAGALVGGLVLRERKHEEELEVASLLSTLRDRKLWRLSLGSGLYLYAQLAVLGFAVVFLHDEHGLSESRANYERRGYTGERQARGYRSFRRRGMPFATTPRERMHGTWPMCRAALSPILSTSRKQSARKQTTTFIRRQVTTPNARNPIR